MFTKFINAENIIVHVDQRVPFTEKAFPSNHPGLVRVLNQYALEYYPDLILPSGVYFVKRTKWFFRPAVYTVNFKPRS